MSPSGQRASQWQRLPKAAIGTSGQRVSQWQRLPKAASGAGICAAGGTQDNVSLVLVHQYSIARPRGDRQIL